ncbi:MAG: hypothetical protein IPF96_01715 [Rhodobacter sp.]|nr:hypothetical protein [Rhodobacter sp.]
MKDKSIKPCIPGRKPCGRTHQVRPALLQTGNGIWPMFGRLKEPPRVARPYDRCPQVFVSAVVLAATVMFRP